MAGQGRAGHGRAGPVRAGAHVMGDDSLYQCRCLSHCLWAESCAFAGTGWADDGVILT